MGKANIQTINIKPVIVMIDIHKTIYSTALDKLGKLRYQAKDDLKGFRSILELIIISDIYEWT